MKKIILILVLFIEFVYSQNFYELNSGTANSLNSGTSSDYIYSNPGFIWVCGNNGTIIKTTNQGNIWVSRNFGLPNNINFYAIDGLDSSKAVVAGNIGTITYVFRTTNGGFNWTQVFSQSNGKINSIFFRRALLGFMSGNPVGGRWSLWKTTNGGASWDSTGLRLPQAGNESGFSNSMWVKGDSVWIGTDNSRIYYSSNYGMTWSVQNTTIQNIYSIFYLNDYFYGEGYAGGDNLIKTTNSGFNWIAQTSGGTGNITGIAEGNPGVYNYPTGAIYLARGSSIAYQIVGNTNWYTYNAPSGSYNYLFKPRSRDTLFYWGVWGKLFGIRDNGGISMCYCTFGAVRRLGNEIPIDYSLLQNYPNPFNPVTKIILNIPVKVTVKVMIYDVLGRLIDVVLDKELTPGEYEADWDATKFSSGIYYYSLQTSEFTQTRKMILIK